MSYGDPTTEGAHRWALADDDAQPFFQQAVELGITFWDTANTYQAGTSEEVTGRAIRRYSRREDIVLATKVFGKMHDGFPTSRTVSRRCSDLGGRDGSRCAWSPPSPLSTPFHRVRSTNRFP